MHADAVTSYLASAGVDWREVAPGEWGFSTDAGGWPLHVGIALKDGLLRVQAEVLRRGCRSTRTRCCTATGAGRSCGSARRLRGWCGCRRSLPASAVSADELDRVLGLLLEAVEETRNSIDEERE